MKKVSFFAFASSLLLLGTSCNRNSSQTAVKEIDPTTFDTTVKPGNDFFNYVNGIWIKNTTIPATEPAWGSFNAVRDSSIVRLHRILNEVSANKNNAAGSKEQKVGDFYAIALDSDKLNKEGISPLKDEFARINAISDNKSLWAETARLMELGSNVMFGVGVGQDNKISTKEIFQIGQGGTLLPSKDYYLDTTARKKDIREKYVVYCTALFKQMGEKDEVAEKDAHKVLDMETEMAKASESPIELRDDLANYHKLVFSDFTKTTPNIDWTICLDTFGVKSLDTVLVGQPKYMEDISKLVKSHSIGDWKTYLSLHLLSEESGRLGDSLLHISFNFWARTMQGTKTMKPRWKRAVEATNGAMGELLGQLYVDKYFSADTKEKVHEIVKNIIAAYKERISGLSWMSADTKKYANEKLDKVTLKLCYPDKWKDYSALAIKNDAYALNAFRVAEYNFNYDMNKLGKPVDKTEWDMSPQTVNAYYNPTMNEIVFPAAILQWPFFDPNRDDAMNYGGIGTVIGHELTHGFDDQGAQYDADGNMRKWWTKEDSVHYYSKLGLVIRQFDNYEIDSVHVQGKLTIGENTADLGGLTIAYQAFENHLKQNPEGVVDGFTPEQRFFISYAQVWRQVGRPAYVRQLVNTNPHSPPMFRVLGPLSNLNEFYTAFNVKPGDAMYRPDSLRAVIW